MSDYVMLHYLFAEYKKELDNRRNGYTCPVWTEKGYVNKQFRPNNKARLQRLRLEISRLMLQMERKMVQFSSMDKKEGWE